MSKPEQFGSVQALNIRQLAMITALKYSIFNAFFIILIVFYRYQTAIQN